MQTSDTNQGNKQLNSNQVFVQPNTTQQQQSIELRNQINNVQGNNLNQGQPGNFQQNPNIQNQGFKQPGMNQPGMQQGTFPQQNNMQQPGMIGQPPNMYGQPGNNFNPNLRPMGGFQQPGGMPGQQGMMGQPGNFNQNMYPMGGFQQPGGMPGQQGVMRPNPYQGGYNTNLMNPTGLSRINPEENKGLQNIQDSGHGGAYETSQVQWGNFTAWCGTYLCVCFCPNPYKIVPEGHSGIIMRFRKFHKLVGPGMYFVNPEVDTLELIDKREKVIDLRKQAVVTRDNMTLIIDTVLFFRIYDTYKSRFAVSNLAMAIQDLAITTMRNVIGNMTMQEFLEKREDIDDKIQAEIGRPAANWGSKITRVLVQDVILPPEFRATMSAGAISKKIGEAKIITAQADVEAARLMKEMSDALSTEAALQIRYLDALEALAKSPNPKMVFFPPDYRDIGTVNEHLDHAVNEEWHKLVSKD